MTAPTLRTSLAILRASQPADDLLELVDMAIVDHEPADREKEWCETCADRFPCATWRCAADELSGWLRHLNGRASSILARIERYEAASHQATGRVA